MTATDMLAIVSIFALAFGISLLIVALLPWLLLASGIATLALIIIAKVI